MSFFCWSRWDHSIISLKMKTFANVWALTNIRCPFSIHRDELTGEFFSKWRRSPMFDDWGTSDVLFLFIEMRPLNNFSDDKGVLECLIIYQHRMSFFSSSRWDHWRISLTMNTFAYVLLLTNIRCCFSFDSEEIIEEFLSRWTPSQTFAPWPTSDVVFFFV